ncbi:DUF167 domain-containing protein [Brevundimonas sp. SL130]|uniref:DUF167 domain-containing protein n=1 Tax=Brevundimonas sp. SL130 TaxID=2995143 RepID=UPI00226C7E04|nr:DUF167 domain-containing protein [Brevundimonas sp. SL130]WAC59941.1 DUF167 domain-containing protein [Brevundimonas sp. SL130]
MARLPIKLQPGASSDRIDGWDVDAEGRPVLKVRLRARPVDGEANAALVKFLAKSLGVSKSSVALERGGQSRLKMIAVEGLDEAEVKARIEALVGGDAA